MSDIWQNITACEDLTNRPAFNIAITGATGWLGLALMDICISLGLHRKCQIRLFGAAARTVRLRDMDVQIEALADAAPLGKGIWLVFHYAFLGKERTEDVSEEAFKQINDYILEKVLKLASTAESVKFVFSSSGAVYAPDRSLVGETANAYGHMKVVHEEKIRFWGSRHSVPLIIPRVFNVGGAFINKQSRYALASFIVQAYKDGTLIVNAPRPTFRSFVDVSELSVLLLLMLNTLSEGQIIFDTGGREVIEMNDLALETAVVISGHTLPVHRPVWEPTFSADWYVGDAKDYQVKLASFGLSPTRLRNIIATTAKSMNIPHSSLYEHTVT